MRISYIFNALSLVMMCIGILLFVPVVVALVSKDCASIYPFILAAFISGGVGYLLRFFVPKTSALDSLNDIKKSEGLFIVVLSWVVFALIASIPYPFFGLSPLNSIFEATSGITTTGATILTHFDYPKAFFFWRSFTQWIGGMGIIVMFIAILPQFAVAGRQMFFAEAPGPTEDKFTPRVRNTASILWKLYVGLTILLVFSLNIAGMPLFDSVCNAMSTISAGGFSPHEHSIFGYNMPSVTWIIAVFMIIAGTSFNLQYKVLLKKNPLLFFKDDEFKIYFGIIIFFVGVLSLFLVYKESYLSVDGIRHSLFQVVSLMTSSGFASVDYTKWSYAGQFILFVAIFAGSCASSAGGGIKISRWVLIIKIMKNEIIKILHPNAVIPVKYNGKAVPVEVLRQVLLFVLQYFLVIAISATIISLAEQNHVLGFTASVTAIGNVGPAFGDIGPLGSFEHLNPVTKIVLIINMLVGRLEIIPFLVMLNPEFWTVKYE